MTDIQVTLMAEQNFGDHGAIVRTAYNVEPGETVEHLLHRLMRAGEFAQPYRNPESPSAWIEIRYVDGTLPIPAVPEHAPF
jgi:hypothetical protein